MKRFAIFFMLAIANMAIWGKSDTAVVSQPDSISLIRLSDEAYTVTKSSADSAYLRNDYVTAIQIYEKLLQTGEAAAIYYNLGNSYYKTDNIGKAIVNYERALLLQPDNADIRANLEIARLKTVDKVTPVPDIFFVAWIKSLMNTLSIDAWAKLGIIFFVLFLISLFAFLFLKQTSQKKLGFIGAVICFLLTVLSNIFAMQQRDALTDRRNAIILTPSVTVRSTPSESGTTLFVLHEGRKVEVKDDSMSEWKEIRLEDGKVGWVPVSSIEII